MDGGGRTAKRTRRRMAISLTPSRLRNDPVAQSLTLEFLDHAQPLPGHTSTTGTFTFTANVWSPWGVLCLESARDPRSEGKNK